MGDHRLSIRVYIEDTDAGGIVYYANYLNFFERARTEWLRASGIEQSITIHANRLFVVRSCSLQFNAPACLDDQLHIVTEIDSVTGASVTFLQRAERAVDGTILVSGTVEVVCVAADTKRPKPLPKQLRAHMIGFSREEC